MKHKYKYSVIKNGGKSSSAAPLLESNALRYVRNVILSSAVIVNEFLLKSLQLIWPDNAVVMSSS